MAIQELEGNKAFYGGKSAYIVPKREKWHENNHQLHIIEYCLRKMWETFVEK